MISSAPRDLEVDKWTRLLHVVHVRNGSVSLGVLSEANKAETTAATGVAIFDDNLRLLVRVMRVRMKSTYGFLDLTELLELGAECAVVGVPSEATVIAC